MPSGTLPHSRKRRVGWVSLLSAALLLHAGAVLAAPDKAPSPPSPTREAPTAQGKGATKQAGESPGEGKPVKVKVKFKAKAKGKAEGQEGAGQEASKGEVTLDAAGLEVDLDAEDLDQEEGSEEASQDHNDEASLQKRFQHGLERALERLRSGPANPRAIEAVAKAYARLGQLDEAEKYAQELLAQDPANEDAALILAAAAHQRGDRNAAMAVLEGAVGKSQKPADDALEALGELLEGAGNLDEAALRLEESLAANPEDDDAYRKLARIYRKKGDEELKVFVKGRLPRFDVPPQVVDGRTLVPFRAVAESLDAEVNWDPERRVVTVRRGDVTVELPIGSPTARVNGQEVSLDVPATILNGRTVVPVRFVSESLGATVDYDDTYRIVIVRER